MKYFSSSVFLFFFLNSIFGQQVFNNSYGLSPETEWAESIAIYEEGVVIGGITHINGNGADDILLAHIDTIGQEIWKLNIGGAKNDVATKVIVVSDGFVVVGYTNSYGNGKTDFYQVKTDFNGNILWERTYGTADYEKCRDVVQTLDGGFLLFGESVRDGIGQDWWVLKTDADGNEEWSQYIGSEEKDDAVFIINTPDGGFLLGGSYALGRYAYKMTAGGDLEWDFYFPSSLGNKAVFNEAIVLGNGDFLVSQSTGRAGLTRLSPTGDVIWERSYFLNTFVNSAIGIYEEAPDTFLLFRNFGYESTMNFLRIEGEEGGMISNGNFNFTQGIVQVEDVLITESGTYFAGRNVTADPTITINHTVGYLVHKYISNINHDWAIWSTNDLAPHEEFTYGIAESASGDYFFLGSREQFPFGGMSFFDWALLSRINPDGELIWEMSLSDTVTGLVDIIRTNDDHLLMAWVEEDALELVAMDEEGNVLMEATFVDTLPNSGYLRDGSKGSIIELPLGGYRIETPANHVFIIDEAWQLILSGTITGSSAGRLIYLESGEFWDLSDEWLMRFDANGNWQYTLNPNYNPIPAEQILQSLVRTPDDQFLILGILKENMDDDFQHFLLKINEDGDIAYQRLIDTPVSEEDPPKFIMNEDGTFYLYGNEESPWPYDVDIFNNYQINPCLYYELQSAFVEKRAADGSFLWRENIGPFKNINDAIIDQEGSIVLSGWHYNENNFDQLLVKIDPSGIVSVEDILEGQQFETKAFPNPGENLLNIELKNVAVDELEIQVVNTLGQVVKIVQKEELEDLSTIQIDTDHWRTGVYFIQYLEKGRIIKTDKWLKIK